jgi:hypothetical protein
MEIQMTAVFGSVRYGRPTGRIIQRDGWNFHEHTDTVWLDENGREVRREPAQYIVGWREEAVEPAPSLLSRALARLRAR